jgi:hypothetical protein
MQLPMTHTTNSLPESLFWRTFCAPSGMKKHGLASTSRWIHRVPSVVKFSDAWENQNDTKNRRAHHGMACAGTHERILRDESFRCDCDTYTRGGQSGDHSRIRGKFQAFTKTHLGSLPRHLGDDFRYPSTRPLQHFLDIRPAQIDTSFSANPSATDRLIDLRLVLLGAEVFRQIFCVSLPGSRIKVREREVQVHVYRPSGTASWRAKKRRRLYV